MKTHVNTFKNDVLLLVKVVVLSSKVKNNNSNTALEINIFIISTEQKHKLIVEI